MALRLRIERRRPPLSRFFSSSSPEDDRNDSDPQPSSISSHFSDVKATLKHQPSGDQPLRHPTPRPSFLSRPQQQQQITPQSLQGLQKLLSEYRSRDPPPPSGPSFQKLYQPNDSTDSSRKATLTSLEGIRESLKGINRRPNVSSLGRDGAVSSGVDRMSLSGFTDSLRLRLKKEDEAAPWKDSGGVGKEVGLPSKIFGKEIREMEKKKEGKAGKQKENLEKTKFVRSYAYEELGEKLRMLRSPADEGVKDFSLKELNDRLIKLKEMEEKVMESKSSSGYFGHLRDTLWSMKLAEEEKEKANAIHRLDILGTLGVTTNFMHHPPKDHLLEKYFHPDNMSSSEKLKIQLEKVREEFKMSESDCGSARVQVAQLTTKIKHLSSVLHKKDKHSRKGLEEMVQRRKRLLKYLRKTDWDSYTMVLSRLGLRDNAELRR